MRNSKKDLEILKQQGNMKSKDIISAKLPIQNINRELNRKVQNNNLRKAMQSSNLNQTEIPQGQDSIRHSVAKVIPSFHDKVQHGPEHICPCWDQLWYRSSVPK